MSSFLPSNRRWCNLIDSLVRFVTNTAKTTTLEGVVGARKRRRRSDYEENFIPTLWTDQVLWPAEVAIGRTVAKVCKAKTILSGMQTLFQFSAESYLPGGGSLKRPRDDGDDDDDLDELGRVRYKSC
jgi:hypothetical protein